MILNLPILSAMVATGAAAAQTACSALLDLTIGSPARAILQATSAIWSSQQANVYDLLVSSRLATCTGTDVDTFVGDYGLVRDGAVASVGNVTLTRFAPVGSATVLVGSTVRTGDVSLTFTILADTTNAYWSALTGTSGGYVVPAGIASITVPVQCTTAGVAGNVITGAISLFGSGSTFDTLSNLTPLVGGIDGESDIALKLRFVAFIGSLTRATLLAVLSAAESVQAGLSCVVRENVDESGASQPGHFVVVVDDGSGHPATGLLTAIYTAVDAVRPICSTFSVQAPLITGIAAAFTITVSSGTKAALFSACQVAVLAAVGIRV